jgi:hypothetical protein
MIRTTVLSLFVAALVTVAVAGTAEAAPSIKSPANLGWGIGFGVSSHGHSHSHVHYVPQVTYVQEPIYGQVFIGNDRWGRPIYATQVIGYRTVPVTTTVPVVHRVRHRPAWSLGFGYWGR